MRPVLFVRKKRSTLPLNHGVRTGIRSRMMPSCPQASSRSCPINSLPLSITSVIVPPLHYVGADAMRKRWEEVCSSLPGPVGYEIADLSITVGEDMAFTHSFNRTSAPLPTGQQIGTWVRWTACWRKIGGQWLLVHDQVSVPV